MRGWQHDAWRGWRGSAHRGQVHGRGRNWDHPDFRYHAAIGGVLHLVGAPARARAGIRDEVDAEAAVRREGDARLALGEDRRAVRRHKRARAGDHERPCHRRAIGAQQCVRHRGLLLRKKQRGVRCPRRHEGETHQHQRRPFAFCHLPSALFFHNQALRVLRSVFIARHGVAVDGEFALAAYL